MYNEPSYIAITSYSVYVMYIMNVRGARNTKCIRCKKYSLSTDYYFPGSRLSYRLKVHTGSISKCSHFEIPITRQFRVFIFSGDNE